MTTRPVIFERVGKTAIITLNRPHRRNALDESIKDALADAIKIIREDRSIHALVLTGSGGNFCSGADLKDDGPAADEKSFFVRDLLHDAHRWHSELMDLEKPVISAVDGYAVGAGMSLALAADFVVASDRAKFAANFPRVGFVPDLSLLYVLPRLVGLSHAKEIVFSARDIAADEALTLGLVQTVVPVDRLLHTAIEYAQRFDHAPTHVLGMAKSILNRSFETDRHALAQLEIAFQGLCAGSNYHAEAMKRFVAKESPLYAGADRLF